MDIKLKREDAMARFMAAKAHKKALIAEMKARVEVEYEKRTGQKATYITTL